MLLELVLGTSAGLAAPIELKLGTRQLSTAELNSLVVGHDVQRVVPPELKWIEPPERFAKDGTYTEFVHRDEHHGTYSISNDSVCVKVAGRAELCRFIFVDKSRRYWISRFKYTRDFTQVEFIPLAE